LKTSKLTERDGREAGGLRYDCVPSSFCMQENININSFLFLAGAKRELALESIRPRGSYKDGLSLSLSLSLRRNNVVAASAFR